MRIEEAIDIIKSECYVFNPLNFDRSTMVNTALDMAVKALEQEPCEDCISKTQALSDYADWYGFGYRDNTFYNHLKNMPSIQPKTDVLDKIRAEIKGWQVDIHDNEYDADKHDFVFERIFEIIDEYKAESEELNE